MKRIAIAVALLALAILPAPPSAMAFAEAESTPQIREVEILVHSRRDREHHILVLHVFPEQGVAVVYTTPDELTERSAVAYAVAIPRRPFAGSLDLSFPGLGTVVGEVGTGRALEGCGGEAGDAPTETFDGKLRFHGVDGRRWKAKRAMALVTPACGPGEVPRGHGEALLMGAVADAGPMIFGPTSIRLFADSLTDRRYLEFLTVAATPTDRATFVAIDREWLHHQVATERWVKRAVLSPKGMLSITASAAVSPGATVRPPAPFFGTGTYRPRTRKLTGSLGVRFPGLTLRLARPPMRANFVDELQR